MLHRMGIILPNGEVSIARLVDQLRDRVAEAQEAAQPPRSVLVHPRVFRAVQACTGYEARHHQPVRVLGLELVSADHIPEEALLLRS